MRFSEVLAASSLVVPFAAAHSVHGLPKIFGIGAPAKRDPFVGPVSRRAAAVSQGNLKKRQNGGTDGMCGPIAGGASCAAGYCCSSAGWCGNTPDYCNAPDCLIDYGSGCDANKVPNGASTRNVPRPQLGDVAYGDEGIYDCVEPGTVAITYDDGPYIYTNYVLDLFAQYKMKATFFVTGINNGKGAIDDASTPWPAVITRMDKEGHQVASHTWSHQDLSKITQQQRLDQMVRNEMAIRNIIQKFPTYMRPPYSSCDEASGCWKDMKDLGYVVTYFDVDTDDYNNITPALIQNAKNNFNKFFQNDDKTTDSFLSIEHDIHEQTAHNLTEYMLKIIQNKGYRGVTVGECLGDPATNWYRSSPGKIVTSSTSRPSATVSSASSTVSIIAPTAVSPDGTCGGSTGYTCIGFPEGSCCSQYGHCGSTDDYCGAGCNPLFGTCSGGAVSSTTPVTTSVPVSTKTPVSTSVPVSTKPPASTSVSVSTKPPVSTKTPVSSIVTSVRPTSTSTSAPAQTSAASNVSTNGRCGARNGGKTCNGYRGQNMCCSMAGMCGSSLLYCAIGCQKGYGSCWF